MGGTADIRKRADENGDKNKQLKSRRQAHSQRTQRGEDQAEQDNRFTSDPVGQCAAECAAHKTGGRKDHKDSAYRCHAYIEFLSEIKREERVEHEPTQAVNENHDVVDPKCSGICVIGVSYFFEGNRHSRSTET